MIPFSSKRFARALSFAVAAAACGGGGDGGTPPVTVASVTITAPAAAPNFGALGRTVQFSAAAKDAAGATISGAAITWASSNAAAASVNASSGLVTAVANGTTTITASSGGHTSTGLTVNVAQVPTALQIAGAPFTMGAIGSVRNLTATAVDSGGATVTTTGVVWTLIPHAVPTVTLTAGGTMTALVNTTPGIADSLRANVTVAAVPLQLFTFVTVAQVANTIALTVPAGDTVLRTSTRTRQFTAVVTDSNAHALTNSPVLAWTSSQPAVATVGATTGLVTAVGDGTTNIQAATGGKTGTRVQLVTRYAETFTITPGSATLSTPGATQLFTGNVRDSANTVLTSTWVARPAGAATISPAAGATTTATAASNGTTYVVLSGGLRIDSALVTVSGQPTAPLAIGVTVSDNLFKSVRNNTQNPAIDTVGVGGTVTWTWNGTNPHSIQSTGSPSFPNSSNPVQTTGTSANTFNTLGTYTYVCGVHGAAMSGTIVVR